MSADALGPARRIVAALGGDKAQRETAYVALSELAEGEADDLKLSTALECTGPLVERALGADTSAVDAAEFQRACLVLAKLCSLSPVKVGQDYLRFSRYEVVWGSAGNAFAVPQALQPAELRPEHAMSIACAHAIDGSFHCPAMQATLDAAGKKFVTPTGSWMESWMGLPNPLSPASTMSLAWLERMARLLLDIVQDPRTSDLVLGGAWLSLVWAVAGRAEEVAVPLIEAGLIAETVTSLRKSQPSEWISLKSPKGIVAASIFAVGWTISTLTFTHLNVTQLLLDTGFLAVGIEAVKAFERQGPGKTGETCVISVWGPLRLLSGLDLAAPEVLPIVEMLGGMASTLQFILSNPLEHSREMGMVTSGECAIILAFAFGKQEAGSAFAFTQEILDDVLQNKLTNFSGAIAPFVPTVTSFFLRPVVHLCISDGEHTTRQCPLATLLTLPAQRTRHSW